MEYFLEGIVSFKDIGTFTQMRRVTNTYKFPFLYYREYITSFKEMLHFKAPAKMSLIKNILLKTQPISHRTAPLLLTSPQMFLLELSHSSHNKVKVGNKN